MTPAALIDLQVDGREESVGGSANSSSMPKSTLAARAGTPAFHQVGDGRRVPETSSTSPLRISTGVGPASSRSRPASVAFATSTGSISAEKLHLARRA